MDPNLPRLELKALIAADYTPIAWDGALSSLLYLSSSNLELLQVSRHARFLTRWKGWLQFLLADPTVKIFLTHAPGSSMQ